MIRYILYWIFNTLLVRYACKWIQTRDSIQESSKDAKYVFQRSGPDHWNVSLRRTLRRTEGLPRRLARVPRLARFHIIDLYIYIIKIYINKENINKVARRPHETIRLILRSPQEINIKLSKKKLIPSRLIWITKVSVFFTHPV
jgi:hypothetical protein